LKYDIDLIIKLRKQGATWKQVGDIYETDGENVRAFAKKHERFGEIREEEKVTDAVKEVIDKRTEDRRTGEVTSEIKRKMREKKTLTDDELLELHAFDPEKFKIRTVTSNEWTMTEGGGDQYYNFQSKIVAEPKEDSVNFEEIGERLAGKVKPRELSINYIPERVDKYAAINLFDPHFDGVSDYDETLGKIFHYLDNNEFNKILLVSGGDLLHVDNHQSTTARGTQLETTDLTQAWEDAYDFLDMLIDKALNSAMETELLYIPGNHDTTTGHTIMKALERVYQKEDRLHIDSAQEMFKATLLGHNFIGATHGVKKNKKDYPMIYATQYSTLWGKEGVFSREVLTGHFHNEHVVDMNGLLIRQNPTRNPTDQWHKDNGFVGAHKRFLMVEYSEYEPEMYKYV